MKIFFKLLTKQKYYFLLQAILFSSTYTMHFIGNNTTSKHKTINPTHSINIVTIIKDLSQYPLDGINIQLSPDETTAVIGFAGKVYSLDMDHTKKQTPIKAIIKHQSKQYTPIIALAKITNKPLLIASAINHSHSKNNTTSGECILFTKSNHKIYKLPELIQSISLTPDGTKIIYAHPYSFGMITPKTNTRCTEIPITQPRPIRIISTAINSDGSIVATALTNGIIDFHAINKKELVHLRTIHCQDPIEHFTFPLYSSKLCYLLYTDYSASTKALSLEQMTNQPHFSQAHIINTKSQKFSHSIKYDNITLNTNPSAGSAHWTKNKDASQEERHQIKAYQYNDKEKCLRKHYLKAPTKQDLHNTLSKTGQLTMGKEHFTTLSFCGQRIIALRSDGKLFLWDLSSPDTDAPGKDKSSEIYNHISSSEEYL